MCGISGIYRWDEQSADEREISAMLEKIKHRGPDDQGRWMGGRVGLGFVRLSIIDLSEAGHQPMKSEDDRYILTFNGEIFNYIEIRDELKAAGVTFRTETDTEVLLRHTSIGAKPVCIASMECGRFVSMTRWSKRRSSQETALA